jgi:hypothetical protein
MMVLCRIDRTVAFQKTYSNLAGEFVWGRGSSDDKSGLIGILYVSYFEISPSRGVDADHTIAHPLKLCWEKNSNLIGRSFSRSVLMKRLVACM